MNAQWVFPLIGAVFAESALLDYTDSMPARIVLIDDAPIAVFGKVALRGLPIERTGTIRARRHAHTASYALVVVNLDATHIVLVRRTRWTNALARGVFAVVAQCRNAHTLHMGVLPFLHFVNVAVKHVGPQTVNGFARYGACIATDAPRCFYYHS